MPLADLPDEIPLYVLMLTHPLVRTGEEHFAGCGTVLVIGERAVRLVGAPLT